MDITASYYEKTVNGATAGIGDVVEVKVFVYWHGYVIPEFKRDVKIIDPFPELLRPCKRTQHSRIQRLSRKLLTQIFAVIGGEGVLIELPKPRLFIDNVEIALSGESPTLSISSK